jgi:septal ring factor EnvC (AmiA/AmiB activator)
MNATAVREMNFTTANGKAADVSQEEAPHSLMAQIDKASTETVTWTKGTLWLIGTTIAAASVIVLILAYVVSGAMGYQGVVNRIDQAETRLDKIEKTLDEFSQMKITLNNVQNDSKVIRETQSANETDRKEMMKNLSDIRILLAQKGMQE